MRMICSTTPVAVKFFVTRYRSRAVHEHEGGHEDVSIVRKTTVLVPSGTEENWGLVELHPAGTGIC